MAGEDRREFYTCLSQIGNASGLLAWDGDSVSGLVVGRRISGCFKLGPVYAESVGVALRLVRAALTGWSSLIGGGLVSLTLPMVSEQSSEWVDVLSTSATRRLVFEQSSTRAVPTQSLKGRHRLPPSFCRDQSSESAPRLTSQRCAFASYPSCTELYDHTAVAAG